LSEKHGAAAADRYKANGSIDLAGIPYEGRCQCTEILTAAWKERGTD